MTTEALERAGWQSEEEALQQRALQRTLQPALLAGRGGGDVVVGPWTGEVGFELLYWIPFLNWLVEQGLDPARLVVVSRGGAAPWYAHLTSRYVDILDLIGVEEFRARSAGPRKLAVSGDDFEGGLLARAKAAAGIDAAAPEIRPRTMYRLFTPLWRKRATVGLVESFLSHRGLTPPAPLAPAERPAGMPPDYVVAKFYFSKAFPETEANRRFVADVVRRVSAEAPLVLLNSSRRLDEHSDVRTASGSGVFVLDPHAEPQKNLELQTRVVCGSRGLIGTYGGFSYLAPFHGVRSLSFFSRRFGFERHHLELAERVFDTLRPGGFLALDRRAIDLVAPAVGQWMQTPAGPADTVDDEALQPERADVLR